MLPLPSYPLAISNNSTLPQQRQNYT
jgi:hypothetical protein